MSPYVNFNRRLSRCLACTLPVPNDFREKQKHSTGHDWVTVTAALTPEAVAYWRQVRRDKLIAAKKYHSVACWAVDCDGIDCDCWCHDDDRKEDQ